MSHDAPPARRANHLGSVGQIHPDTARAAAAGSWQDIELPSDLTWQTDRRNGVPAALFPFRSFRFSRVSNRGRVKSSRSSFSYGLRDVLTDSPATRQPGLRGSASSRSPLTARTSLFQASWRSGLPATLKLCARHGGSQKGPRAHRVLYGCRTGQRRGAFRVSSKPIRSCG